MTSAISDLAAKVLEGNTLENSECERIFFAGDDEHSELLFFADKIRRRNKGVRIRLCSIINAKSGMCPEDCRFCAQSARSRAEVKTYPLVSVSEIEGAYERALRDGASCFGIVTSGRGISDAEIESVGEAVKKISRTDRSVGAINRAEVSASLGEIGVEQISYLKKQGLKKYHHNIETSQRFFPSVCSTHTYADRVKTLRAVKSAGLELCCGGLFGIGETPRDRFETAMAIRDISPDTVPLNFLNPVAGTPLEEGSARLSPREILRLIAAFRFALPDKGISVCGGRENSLGDLQSWIFYAGADGMMTGGYLTTPGRPSEDDLKMIKDLGLEVVYGR